MFIPIIMLFISIGLLANNYARTGNFIQKDVELTGGKIISFPIGNITLSEIEKIEPNAMITKTGNEYLIQIPYERNETNIINTLKETHNISDYNIQSVGQALGNIFWIQSQYAIITAFILMGIIVFILFKSFVPSIAVMLAATTDIITTAAIMDTIGIKLSLATLAALLMLIGYSIDTDILLTTRSLKLSIGTLNQRIYGAMKTGLTMSATTITAVSSLILISEAPVIEEIAEVLLIGLFIDLLSTWLTNAGILKLWLGRKHENT